MLYKFKSKACGDLIMLQPTGQRVLTIIGKDPYAAIGIILPTQMGPAIAALEAAVIEEDRKQQALRQEATARAEPQPRFEAITLRQRSLPFLNLLRRSQQEDTEIVWGV